MVKERSTSYPSIDLEDAIARIRALRTNYGKGPYSREDAAKGIGYGGISGASARAVAALVQYGLLNRTGNTYSQSILAEKILFPVPGEDTKAPLAAAALAPTLFGKLYDQFKGQALPSLLENVLMRHGVAESVSKEAAQTFRKTLAYSGLFKDGVVRSESVLGDISNEMNELKEAPITEIPPVSSTQYTDTSAGKSWKLSLVSKQPFSARTRKLLFDLKEALEEDGNQ